jgi:cysteinyl-tRNA synthetase
MSRKIKPQEMGLPLDNEDQISDARETFREMIVQLGLRFDESPKDIPSILSPLMDILLEVRERLRTPREWEMADWMRVQLLNDGFIVEDTPQGPRWRLKPRSWGVVFPARFSCIDQRILCQSEGRPLEIADGSPV